MKYIRHLIFLVAALLVLPMTGCLCSQLYSRHQVSKLMNYQGMSKAEVLKRVCEIDVAHYDANPPDVELSPPNKVEIQVFAWYVSGESYETIKDSPDLWRAPTWVVHGRSYGLSDRQYSIKLTFDDKGFVTDQKIVYYTPK